MFLFGLNDFSTHVQFNPAFVGFIFNILFWLLPTCIVFIFAVYILYKLRIISNRNKKRKMKSVALAKAKSKSTDNMDEQNNYPWPTAFKLNCCRKRFRLDSQQKFSIIIFSYLAQWMPPCLLSTLNGLCSQCVNGALFNGFYWLTYTVCLIDPLVVLIINTNVSLFGHRKL